MSENLLEKGSVNETLFIPLHVKAKETKDPKGVIRDPKAVEISEKVNVDISRFDGGNITHVGIIARTEVMDQGARKFLKENPKGTIINLGAGLDTRLTRVDNGSLKWFDLDMPEVIELRKKFFSESDSVKFIPKSVFDSSWVNDVDIDTTEPVLIIAEGILMYFKEEEVKKIFNVLYNAFPNAEMYFDVVHTYFIGKGVSANFNWGIDKGKDIENLHPGIRLVESWSTGDLHKKRQTLFFRVMNIFTSIRNRSQILHINFCKSK
ncbi:MAG: class I SAM-dependent methyltransferase [Clostridia bacterium]|nr:class I SAM-dependent methyltransferase [Clostridia bacterium]